MAANWREIFTFHNYIWKLTYSYCAGERSGYGSFHLVRLPDISDWGSERSRYLLMLCCASQCLRLSCSSLWLLVCPVLCRRSATVTPSSHCSTTKGNKWLKRFDAAQTLSCAAECPFSTLLPLSVSPIQHQRAKRFQRPACQRPATFPRQLQTVADTLDSWRDS